MEEFKNGQFAKVQLLTDWAWRAKRATLAHYSTTRFRERRHYVLGIMLVFSSAISTSLSGRSLFGFSNAIIDTSLTLFSVVTLGIACVHVFLGDQNRSERHRMAGTKYASVKRDIEQALADIEDGGSVEASKFDSIRRILDQLGEDAPPIPKSIWSKTEAKALNDKRKPSTPQVGSTAD